MSNQSLKSKATSGFIWNAVERFSVTIGQFIIGIILARLLMPEDFGLIGMLSIFIAISQVFIQSGMGSGLIQKQDRVDEDFSTVFIFNLIVSTLFYVLLFLSAPLIASFYEMPLLSSLTRVLGITLIINSLSIVQRTKLEIEVNFKTLAKVNIIALVIGGALAIGAALYEFGVWALVIQTLSISVVTAIGLWILGNWSLSLVFSKTSFKQLFSYGSKLLAAGLYAKSLQEVYNLVIGKAYSASELGFFTQARKFAEVSSSTLTNVLQKVTFPILSSLQYDEKRMVSVYGRMIRMAAFISFPTLSLLAVLAEPLISILLGEKWLPVAPLLQWLCIAKLVYPISVINMNILNAVGRSDLFLKVDLSKFPLIVIVLVVTIPISLEAVVIGQVVTSFISFFINAYLPGKLYGYGSMKQLKDTSLIIFATIFMVIVTLTAISFVDSAYLQLVLGFLSAMFGYLSMSYLLKIKELTEIINIVQERL